MARCGWLTESRWVVRGYQTQMSMVPCCYDRLVETQRARPGDSYWRFIGRAVRALRPALSCSSRRCSISFCVAVYPSAQPPPPPPSSPSSSSAGAEPGFDRAENRRVARIVASRQCGRRLQRRRAARDERKRVAHGVAARARLRAAAATAAKIRSSARASSATMRRRRRADDAHQRSRRTTVEQRGENRSRRPGPVAAQQITAAAVRLQLQSAQAAVCQSRFGADRHSHTCLGAQRERERAQ
uniref:Uncharacterized protein n=1 Tax=Plectus sambesii TaxID=2011161 RepID=A0A914VX80_9BILA